MDHGCLFLVLRVFLCPVQSKSTTREVRIPRNSDDRKASVTLFVRINAEQTYFKSYLCVHQENGKLFVCIKNPCVSVDRLIQLGEMVLFFSRQNSSIDLVGVTLLNSICLGFLSISIAID